MKQHSLDYIFSDAYRAEVIAELFNSKQKKKSLEQIELKVNKDLSKALLSLMKVDDLNARRFSETAARMLKPFNLDVKNRDKDLDSIVPTTRVGLALQGNAYRYIEKEKRNLVVPYYLRDSTNYKKLRSVHTKLKKAGVISCYSIDFETIFTTADPMRIDFIELLKLSKAVVPLKFKKANTTKKFINCLEDYVTRAFLHKYDYAYGLVYIGSQPNYDFGKFKSSHIKLSVKKELDAYTEAFDCLV